MPPLKPVVSLLLCFIAGLVSIPALPATPPIDPLNLDTYTLSQLESELKRIDEALDNLAHYSLRGGIGSIGFRSDRYTTADNTEWVEVQLDKEYPIDEIILVPTISRDVNEGFHADSFPENFRVIAGSKDNSQGSLIATIHTSEDLRAGISPYVLPTPGASASWIRIEATRLSLRSFDNMFTFQLAELLVFSGKENVALRQPVKASSNHQDRAGAWDERFLVDGFTPYLMDSSQGSQSIAYVSIRGQQPSLTIDLGSEYPLSRIQLHTVDQSDTVPQAYAGDLGIPQHLRIEGATQADFSDAKLLLDYRRESINDTGPILMWRIPEITSRYVRLSAGENLIPLDPFSPKFRIGFAEIELFSKGDNVALHKPTIIDTQLEKNARSPTSLTDGNNLYGKILPIQDWLKELARRHELSTQRPYIVAELSQRYAQQKTNLKRVSWLAGILAIGIFAFVLINRFLQIRQMTRMKERFAADLHDELGANLHTIGLLSDLAIESIDTREELADILKQVRILTERSGSAARNCTNILEAKGICENLVEAMNRSSSRLLADLEHDIDFIGEDEFKKLKPRKRIDLFFFYKECLTNIIRHSGATRVSTRLTATRSEISLTVNDNGIGISAHSGNSQIPPSLKRRARLLGARVFLSPTDAGTCINLKLKTKRIWILK